MPHSVLHAQETPVLHEIQQLLTKHKSSTSCACWCTRCLWVMLQNTLQTSWQRPLTCLSG